jgi:hypothetical protein
MESVQIKKGFTTEALFMKFTALLLSLHQPLYPKVNCKEKDV